jgi:hypothetical protein
VPEEFLGGGGVAGWETAKFVSKFLELSTFYHPPLSRITASADGNIQQIYCSTKITPIYAFNRLTINFFN